MLTELIALGWMANIFVKFYTDAFKNYPRIRTLKPMSCQICCGFYIGCLYYYHLPIAQIIIFASLTSLTTCLLNGLVNKLNA